MATVSRSSRGGLRIATVKNRDSLATVAQKCYGGTGRWIDTYKENKDLIEAAAKAHGYSDSDGGGRIWPGTQLVIPS
jgi:hypothetical protein